MRPNSNQKRSRNGRGHLRRPHGGGGGGGGGGGYHRNQSLDSSGPDVKLRGTANQIFEKYLLLARDANSSGDRVSAENYLQHAEHYYRLMMAMGTVPQPRPNGHPHDGPGEDEQPQGGQTPANPDAPQP